MTDRKTPAGPTKTPPGPVPLEDAALDSVTGGVVAFSYGGGWNAEQDGPPPGDQAVEEARPGLRGGS
ncbi:hypothetical protein [Falsiroseomonas sp.]|uniref:hypothetical protein n=1 Tax=Falsiroseomonas sp. TaxID=2870721 RepID=UPI003F71EEAA